MKIALLLSGLQRNFEPFIQNQVETIVKKYDCDIFIYTSTENNNRYIENGKIMYKQNGNIENSSDYFKEKYKLYLKNIYIDVDNESFEKFKTDIVKYDEKDNIFHLNLISSYFKVRSCISLMEQYEEKNNIKYDIVFRMRLDGFTHEYFKNVKINTFDYNNKCYMSIGDNQHKDDSCVIISRTNIDIIKNFVFQLIHKKNQPNNIIVENELIHYLTVNNIDINFINKLVCRIGSDNLNYREIPYFNYENINKLHSLEYKVE